MHNAKNIDILNLYHSTFKPMVLIRIYKKLNSNGISYVKLDGGFTLEESPIIKRWFRGYVIKHATLVSTEFEYYSKILSNSWKRHILTVGNPYNPNEIVPYKEYSKRENIILYVGNIGYYPKGVDILLDAIKNVFKKDKIGNYY